MSSLYYSNKKVSYIVNKPYTTTIGGVTTTANSYRKVGYGTKQPVIIQTLTGTSSTTSSVSVYGCHKAEYEMSSYNCNYLSYTGVAYQIRTLTNSGTYTGYKYTEANYTSVDKGTSVYVGGGTGTCTKSSANTTYTYSPAAGASTLTIVKYTFSQTTFASGTNTFTYTSKVAMGGGTGTMTYTNLQTLTAKYSSTTDPTSLNGYTLNTTGTKTTIASSTVRIITICSTTLRYTGATTASIYSYPYLTRFNHTSATSNSTSSTSSTYTY